MFVARLLGVCGCLVLAACSRTDEAGEPSEISGGTGPRGGTGGASSATAGTTGSAIGGLNITPVEPPDPEERGLPDCVNCRWTSCPAGKATTVSGTVRTPAKVAPDPLYNAVVYVPGAAIEPFSDTVSCDRCGNVSGKPLAATLSGSDGTFTLDDVPAGQGVPLVLQMGRWRRQVVLPDIVECQDNPLPEDLTRFPRNRSEGDIPRMALVTSTYDPEECILRKIGIDDAEFATRGQDGRIHLFAGGGAKLSVDTPSGTELWDDPAMLARYDMVLVPCASTPEGLAEGDDTTYAAARTALAGYANAGGRVFATDLSFSWIIGEGSPFAATAQWVANPRADEHHASLQSAIDTTFPKGQALAEWLQGIGATSTAGELTLHDTYRRSVSVNPPTQRWLYSQQPESLQSFTFNTPIDAAAEQQCGRFAYSSFHIASSGFTATFPEECDEAPLTPQERVLEFMLFDLASCVQIDTGEPKPPVIVK
jgi:hypothetical protein